MISFNEWLVQRQWPALITFGNWPKEKPNEQLGRTTGKPESSDSEKLHAATSGERKVRKTSVVH